MLRPFLHVARPTDWTGRLAEAAIAVIGGLALLPVVLVRLPSRWLEAVHGHGWSIRAAMLVLGFWILMWVRAWLLARLPLASYLFWNTLVFSDRGEQRRVAVRDIAELYVELRPAGLTQVLMVQFRDGSLHELCPVDSPGAGRLFRVLTRRLEARRRRDAQA